ncbi:hypothetical protein [Streptomyces sp. IB2014 016-6]|uniref:hypothetical protein n=1 Tax=Streptomyces sp. IB2014 016-6 TaxID=2517818 RepID=UPI001F4FDF29|nr:hypothetical protein [Streptomyces sp. IB2014 016-6]
MLLYARKPSTLAEQFAGFDREHPWVNTALEQLVSQRLASGARRVGMKALFEALRWRHPRGMKGLNNNYAAFYARQLLAAHPEWAPVIEIRRRRTP